MWSIFDIIDGSKVNTFRLNYWEWSNASCDNLCLVLGEFYGENWMGRFNEHQIWSKQVSEIPYKNLFLVFLHFICFQNVSSFSSLQKFYNNPFLRTLRVYMYDFSSAQYSERLNNTVMPWMRFIVFDLGVLYIYIKNPRLFSLFSQLYANFWQFLYHSSCLFSYPFILVRFFEIPMFFKFGHVIRYISFSFIPLRKGATIDTYSSIKRTHFTLCAFTINFSSFVTTKFENLHSWRGELTSTSCHWFRSALLCHTGNLWFMARTLSQSWISCHN